MIAVTLRTMGEKLHKVPELDWHSPGDMHKRFLLFKQKCNLIFNGTLEAKAEAYKVRLLLLWIGDKGLEIYNTASWSNDGDNMKLDPVFEKLEAHVKPLSNQIIARFHLRSLKQGDKHLEEFVTEVRALVDDGGYVDKAKEEAMRDALVFGINSNKARHDAFAVGNNLTFQQVYNFAKTEESADTQMKMLERQGAQQQTVHAVSGEWHQRHNNSASTYSKPRYRAREQQHSAAKATTQPKGSCYNCGDSHERGKCPAKDTVCYHCGIKGHFKRVCMKKRGGRQVHDVADQDQELEEVCDNIVKQQVGSVTTIHSVSSSRQDGKHPAKIYANIRLNDSQNKIKFKIDTGSDACLLTETDFERSGLKGSVKIHPSNCVLHSYGGGIIKNLGTVKLKVSCLDKSINADFRLVKSMGSPSLIGCSQALELNLIKFNNGHETTSLANTNPSRQTIQAVHQVETPNVLSSTLSSITPQATLTKEAVLQQYKDCFDKVGRFPGEKYHISLNENAKPVVHAPRTVPVHVMPLYKAELDKMLQDGIITPVSGPTDWVNSIVCNIKDTDEGKKVRLCLDPKDLNKAIKREHYYTRTIDEILPQLHGKKYFSVVDTKKGYWHVELDDESSLLTTFNTPFGRFRFLRMPFGLWMSQDVFQPKLDECYAGIDNVTGIADDIIVSGKTIEEHDQAFKEMLDATRMNNISLNSSKMQFRQASVTFYGHEITDSGIKPTADKMEAIRNLKTPESLQELMSILGLATYLTRFSAKLASLTSPLRELNKKDAHFRWERRHQQALESIKAELCRSTALWFYDPDPATETTLQTDASLNGLGAWLRQAGADGNERIVAMRSRTLTAAESRYSNIERECLAVQWGLEKFEYYLLGRHVVIETDHAPLEQIFKKSIAEAPARLQRLLLKCMKFDVEVRYKPGKSIPVADALSRVCVGKRRECDVMSSPDPVLSRPKADYDINFIEGVKHDISHSKVKEEADKDPGYGMLKAYVHKGWPSARKECPEELWEYWNFRCELTLNDGLVTKGDRLVVPQSLRQDVLRKIHAGHQGETKCILLARESVFWPGITNDIKSMIQRCSTCAQHQYAQPKMPMQQPDLPTRPWSKLGTDIFEYKGSHFLIIVDYYSRFPVIRLLNNIRASTISDKFTAVLLEYGLPDRIVADYGTQYTSEEFRQKCKDSNIELSFSSPYHHQANSVAERTVGTLKHLWRKSEQDGQPITTALYMYRTTPLSDDLPSPYELLFGRKPMGLIPHARRGASEHPNHDTHVLSNQQRQQTQAYYYNQLHHSEKRPLHPGEPVSIYNTLTKSWDPGHVVTKQQERSYVVSRNGKELPRTRDHLRPRQAPVPPPTRDMFSRTHVNSELQPEAQQQPTPTQPDTEGAPAAEQLVAPTPPQRPLYSTVVASPVRTRAGRIVRPPDRYTN